MAALGRVDVLVTPCQPEVAPKIATATGLTSKDAVMRQFFGTRAHRGPFNLSGVPALALPIGFSRRDPEGQPGLPISLQVVGRPFDEASLFRLGIAYQSVTPWHNHHPPLT
jgi:Asp-tRNA(Asn)/Glu-tRNA(Gln) amidotransferase A subunit family amidase